MSFFFVYFNQHTIYQSTQIKVSQILYEENIFKKMFHEIRLLQPETIHEVIR